MKVPLTPVRFLRYARQQFPHKTAVVCRQQRFTYAQFAERAGHLAGALVAAGAQPSDRVAFLSTNCHRLLEAYYGVLEASCVLLPLNLRLTPPELAYILNDAGARFLFMESPFLAMLDQLRLAVPSVEAVFVLDSDGQAAENAPAHYEELLTTSPEYECDLTAVDEDSVAEIFYTSGTDSAPKGVMLTHRIVYLHALSIIVAMQTSPATAGDPSSQSVQLHTIPLFHANGWGAAHSITLVGGTHVMIRHFNPSEVFRLIERERVTSMGVVPTMATAMINSALRSKYDLSSLRSMVVGGAASSPTLVREVEKNLGCVCITGYGLTECSPVLAMSPMKAGVTWDQEERYAGQAKAGFAVPGVEIRVVDESGHDVPHDGETVGEVVARGDAIMKGYWHLPDATRAVMKDGWFHTGDAATLDENNYVLIVDRKKDIIISGGENISSLDLENTLAAHPSVLEAAVIPIPDPRWGEVPKALVVLRPGCTATAAELLEFCRSRLAHYKCPRLVQFLEALPRNDVGKVLKKELLQKYGAALGAAA